MSTRPEPSRSSGMAVTVSVTYARMSFTSSARCPAARSCRRWRNVGSVRRPALMSTGPSLPPMVSTSTRVWRNACQARPVALVRGAALEDVFLVERVAERAGEHHDEVADVDRGGRAEVVEDVEQQDEVAGLAEVAAQAPQLGALPCPANPGQQLRARVRRRPLDAAGEQLDRVLEVEGGVVVEPDVLRIVGVQRPVLKCPEEVAQEDLVLRGH